jgi:dolichol-phosphate mannosyltransferase
MVSARLSLAKNGERCLSSKLMKADAMSDPQGSYSGVGIVIPTYKEAENIGKLVVEVLRLLPGARIAVVDDSPDGETERVVKELGLEAVSLVARRKKGGRGSAVLEGMLLLAGKGCERIVDMDADFSHPPGELPALLREAEERKLDLLIASRYLPGSQIRNWSLARRALSKTANILSRLLLRYPVTDYTNAYRVYSRNACSVALQSCGRHSKGFITLSESLVNFYSRGLRVGERPTIWNNRVRGESTVDFAEIKNAAVGLVNIWRLKRRLEKEQSESGCVAGPP